MTLQLAATALTTAGTLTTLGLIALALHTWRRDTRPMPGHNHGTSIKAPRVYEALRRLGYSKSKAARISNAHAAGSLRRSSGSSGSKRRRARGRR